MLSHDEEFVLICAMRYAFHRLTYAPDIVSGEILRNADNMSDNAIKTIIQDIEHELEFLHDDLNRRIWTNLLVNLKKKTGD